MSRAVKAQLISLRNASINPRETWVKANRATLLAQIKNTVVPERPSFWQSFPRMVTTLISPQALFRPIASLLVVALTVSGWVATSKASRGALPGDALYSVKIASEKTQVAWVSMLNDKTKSAQLHVELAGRRADEVKQIVTGTPDKKSRVSETVNNVKQELVAANQKLEDIKLQTSPTLSQDVVTAIKQQTDDIKKSLQEVKVSLQTSTTSADKLLSEQVADVKNTAKDTDITTVQVAVADHFKANSALSKDYVNALIDTTLTHVVTEAGETKGNVAEVKTLVTEAVHGFSTSSSPFIPTSSLTLPSSTIELPSSTVNTSTTVAANSSTENIKQKISIVAGETAQAALKTQAAADQLSQKVDEVKQLLSTGDLSSAATKIQEVSDASKEVEKIADASILKVQTNLPNLTVEATTTASSSSSTVLLKDKIDSVLRSSSGSNTTATTVVSSTIVSSSLAETGASWSGSSSSSFAAPTSTASPTTDYSISSTTKNVKR